MSENLVYDVSREAEGIACKCNGFADRSEESPTPEEIKAHDCGRSYACCTAVFVCRLCNTRIIGRLNSPEMS